MFLSITFLLQDGLGTPLHELGHALGAIHEQNRLDRDEWIQVLDRDAGMH